MVDYSSTYTRKTDAEWYIGVLRHEVRTLQLEKDHLEVKRHERPLNHWELRRSEELLDEAMKLMGELGSVKAQMPAS